MICLLSYTHMLCIEQCLVYNRLAIKYLLSEGERGIKQRLWLRDQHHTIQNRSPEALIKVSSEETFNKLIFLLMLKHYQLHCYFFPPKSILFSTYSSVLHLEINYKSKLNSSKIEVI